jgi:choline kinase
MVRLGRQTIIERQLSALTAVGVESVIVVAGYKKAILEDFISGRHAGIQFVENGRFSSTNTIYSLYLAAPFLKDDFFLLNGDVLLEKGLLIRLMAETGTALAVEHKCCGGEEVKVKLDGRRITAISKGIPPEDAEGEFVGAALFRRMTHDAFFARLRHEVETCDVTNDYFERALDRIANRVELLAVDVTGEPVIEVDFPEDLEKARALAERMEDG